MIPINDHSAVHLEPLLLARGTTHGTAALGDGLAVSSKAKHPEARDGLLVKNLVALAVNLSFFPGRGVQWLTTPQVLTPRGSDTLFQEHPHTWGVSIRTQICKPKIMKTSPSYLR